MTTLNDVKPFLNHLLSGVASRLGIDVFLVLEKYTQCVYWVVASNAIRTMTTIKEINKGDVLTFQGSDNLYKAILCTSDYKEKSPHYYTFAALTYDSKDKPTIADIYDTFFYGIGNIKDDYFQYSSSERDKIWATHPEIKPYTLGSYGLTIWRKDFMKFHGKVEQIGTLDIVDNLDKNGRGSMNASDGDFLRDFFTDKYRKILEERGQKTFKLRSIIRG